MDESKKLNKETCSIMVENIQKIQKTLSILQNSLADAKSISIDVEELLQSTDILKLFLMFDVFVTNLSSIILIHKSGKKNLASACGIEPALKNEIDESFIQSFQAKQAKQNEDASKFEDVVKKSVQTNVCNNFKLKKELQQNLGKLRLFQQSYQLLVNILQKNAVNNKESSMKILTLKQYNEYEFKENRNNLQIPKLFHQESILNVDNTILVISQKQNKITRAKFKCKSLADLCEFFLFLHKKKFEGFCIGNTNKDIISFAIKKQYLQRLLNEGNKDHSFSCQFVDYHNKILYQFGNSDLISDTTKDAQNILQIEFDKTQIKKLNFRVPHDYAQEKFIGRNNDLNNLDILIKEKQIAVASGEAGIEKAALVYQYFAQQTDKCVLWLNAEEYVSLFFPLKLYMSIYCLINSIGIEEIVEGEECIEEFINGIEYHRSLSNASKYNIFLVFRITKKCKFNDKLISRLFKNGFMLVVLARKIKLKQNEKVGEMRLDPLSESRSLKIFFRYEIKIESHPGNENFFNIIGRSSSAGKYISRYLKSQKLSILELNSMLDKISFDNESNLPSILEKLVYSIIKRHDENLLWQLLYTTCFNENYLIRGLLQIEWLDVGINILKSRGTIVEYDDKFIRIEKAMVDVLMVIMKNDLCCKKHYREIAKNSRLKEIHGILELIKKHGQASLPLLPKCVALYQNIWKNNYCKDYRSQILKILDMIGIHENQIEQHLKQAKNQNLFIFLPKKAGDQIEEKFEIKISTENCKKQMISASYEIYINALIEEGSFGNICKGINKHTKEKVVCKILSTKNIANREKAFEKEKQILLKVPKSPFLLKLLYAENNEIQNFITLKKERMMFFITNYCDFTLDEFIQSMKSLPCLVAWELLPQLVEGLYQLSLANITHRDFKPDNIFLKFARVEKSLTNLICVIGDFGVASLEKIMSEQIGAKEYRAPEMMNHQEYTKQVDIYSLGLVLHEMVFGERYNKTKYENYRLTEEQIQKLFRQEKGNCIYKMLIEMTQSDPILRITIEQLHKLFEDVEIIQIINNNSEVFDKNYPYQDTIYQFQVPWHYANNEFVGRTGELETFSNNFKKYKLSIVYGEAGIGKTAFVYHYLKKVKYNVTVWLNVDDYVGLIIQLKTYIGLCSLIDPLKVACSIADDEIIETFTRCLNLWCFKCDIPTSRAVLVLKNIVETEFTQKLLQQLYSNKFKIIIITRSHSYNNKNNKIYYFRLGQLSYPESRELYKKYDVKIETENCKDWFEVANGNPLAIKYVCAFMKSNKIKLSEYQLLTSKIESLPSFPYFNEALVKVIYQIMNNQNFFQLQNLFCILCFGHSILPQELNDLDWFKAATKVLESYSILKSNDEYCMIIDQSAIEIARMIMLSNASIMKYKFNIDEEMIVKNIKSVATKISDKISFPYIFHWLSLYKITIQSIQYQEFRNQFVQDLKHFGITEKYLEHYLNQKISPIFSESMFVFKDINNEEYEFSESNKEYFVIIFSTIDNQSHMISSTYDIFIDDNYIGKGSYSKVLHGKNKHTNYGVACKVLFDVKGATNQQHIDFETEKRILKDILKINSPHLLKLFYASDQDAKHHSLEKNIPKRFFITEHCDGTLRDFIESKNHLSCEEALEILTQIINGLYHLSLKGITHRDIKPENIFYKNTCAENNLTKTTWVLADFGCASYKKYMKEYAGTEAYMAPEICCQKEDYTCQVDIYSLGLVLHEMVFGERYYKNEYKNYILEESGKEKLLKQLKGAEICDLLSRMTKINPANRITVQKLYEVIQASKIVEKNKINNDYLKNEVTKNITNENNNKKNKDHFDGHEKQAENKNKGEKYDNKDKKDSKFIDGLQIQNYEYFNEFQPSFQQFDISTEDPMISIDLMLLQNEFMKGNPTTLIVMISWLVKQFNFQIFVDSEDTEEYQDSIIATFNNLIQISGQILPGNNNEFIKSFNKIKGRYVLRGNYLKYKLYEYLNTTKGNFYIISTWLQCVSCMHGGEHEKNPSLYECIKGLYEKQVINKINIIQQPFAESVDIFERNPDNFALLDINQQNNALSNRFLYSNDLINSEAVYVGKFNENESDNENKTFVEFNEHMELIKLKIYSIFGIITPHPGLSNILVDDTPTPCFRAQHIADFKPLGESFIFKYLKNDMDYYYPESLVNDPLLGFGSALAIAYLLNDFCCLGCMCQNMGYIKRKGYCELVKIDSIELSINNCKHREDFYKTKNDGIFVLNLDGQAISFDRLRENDKLEFLFVFKQLLNSEVVENQMWNQFTNFEHQDIINTLKKEWSKNKQFVLKSLHSKNSFGPLLQNSQDDLMDLENSYDCYENSKKKLLCIQLSLLQQVLINSPGGGIQCLLIQLNKLFQCQIFVMSDYCQSKQNEIIEQLMVEFPIAGQIVNSQNLTLINSKYSKMNGCRKKKVYRIGGNSWEICEKLNFFKYDIYSVYQKDGGVFIFHKNKEEKHINLYDFLKSMYENFNDLNYQPFQQEAIRFFESPISLKIYIKNFVRYFSNIQPNHYENNGNKVIKQATRRKILSRTFKYYKVALGNILYALFGINSSFDCLPFYLAEDYKVLNAQCDQATSPKHIQSFDASFMSNYTKNKKNCYYPQSNNDMPLLGFGSAILVAKILNDLNCLGENNNNIGYIKRNGYYELVKTNTHDILPEKVDPTHLFYFFGETEMFQLALNGKRISFKELCENDKLEIGITIWKLKHYGDIEDKVWKYFIESPYNTEFKKIHSRWIARKEKILKYISLVFDEWKYSKISSNKSFYNEERFFSNRMLYTIEEGLALNKKYNKNIYIGYAKNNPTEYVVIKRYFDIYSFGRYNNSFQNDQLIDIDLMVRKFSKATQIKSPFVVKYICGQTVEDNTSNLKALDLVMELCDGNMQQYLSKLQKKQLILSQHDALIIFCQLVEGLHEFHQHNIAHGNFKLEYILYKKELIDGECVLIWKIAGFDVSQFQYISLNNKKPEANKEINEIPDQDENKHVDIWLLGLVLHKLLFGEPYFKFDGSTLKKEYILTNEQETQVDNQIKNLLYGMMQSNRKYRITIEYIRNELKSREEYEIVNKILKFNKQNNNMGNFDNLSKTYGVVENRRIGKIMHAKNQFHKALNLFMEIKYWIEKTKIKKEEYLCKYVYTYISNCLEVLGQNKEALEFYNKLLEFSIKNNEKNHLKTLYYYEKVGDLQMLLKEYNVALQHYENALKIKLEIYKKNHIEIAKAYKKKGKVLKAQQDYEAALKQYYDYFKISVLHNEEEHMKEGCQNIKEIIQLLGLNEAALNYYINGKKVDRSEFLRKDTQCYCKKENKIYIEARLLEWYLDKSDRQSIKETIELLRSKFKFSFILYDKKYANKPVKILDQFKNSFSIFGKNIILFADPKTYMPDNKLHDNFVYFYEKDIKKWYDECEMSNNDGYLIYNEGDVITCINKQSKISCSNFLTVFQKIHGKAYIHKLNDNILGNSYQLKLFSKDQIDFNFISSCKNMVKIPFGTQLLKECSNKKVLYMISESCEKDQTGLIKLNSNIEYHKILEMIFYFQYKITVKENFFINQTQPGSTSNLNDHCIFCDTAKFNKKFVDFDANLIKNYKTNKQFFYYPKSQESGPLLGFGKLLAVMHLLSDIDLLNKSWKKLACLEKKGYYQIVIISMNDIIEGRKFQNDENFNLKFSNNLFFSIFGENISYQELCQHDQIEFLQTLKIVVNESLAENQILNVFLGALNQNQSIMLQAQLIEKKKNLLQKFSNCSNMIESEVYNTNIRINRNCGIVKQPIFESEILILCIDLDLLKEAMQQLKKEEVISIIKSLNNVFNMQLYVKSCKTIEDQNKIIQSFEEKLPIIGQIFVQNDGEFSIKYDPISRRNILVLNDKFEEWYNYIGLNNKNFLFYLDGAFKDIYCWIEEKKTTHNSFINALQKIYDKQRINKFKKSCCPSHEFNILILDSSNFSNLGADKNIISTTASNQVFINHNTKTKYIGKVSLEGIGLNNNKFTEVNEYRKLLGLSLNKFFGINVPNCCLSYQLPNQDPSLLYAPINHFKKLHLMTEFVESFHLFEENFLSDYKGTKTYFYYPRPTINGPMLGFGFAVAIAWLLNDFEYVENTWANMGYVVRVNGYCDFVKIDTEKILSSKKIQDAYLSASAYNNTILLSKNNLHIKFEDLCENDKYEFALIASVLENPDIPELFIWNSFLSTEYSKKFIELKQRWIKKKKLFGYTFSNSIKKWTNSVVSFATLDSKKCVSFNWKAYSKNEYIESLFFSRTKQYIIDSKMLKKRTISIGYQNNNQKQMIEIKSFFKSNIIEEDIQTEIQSNTDACKNNFVNEMKALLRVRKIRSPFLINYIGAQILDDEILYRKTFELAMEHCDGNLLGFFRKKKNRSKILSKFDAMAIFCQIVEGVFMIHKNGITHRDIKPENILYKKVVIEGEEIKVWKIGYFGAARLENDMTGNKGASFYRAPEMGSATVYSNSVDIWSLGLILHKLLFAEDYYNKKEFDFNDKESYSITNKQFIKVAKELQELLYEMMMEDSTKRINIEEIREKMKRREEYKIVRKIMKHDDEIEKKMNMEIETKEMDVPAGVENFSEIGNTIDIANDWIDLGSYNKAHGMLTNVLKIVKKCVQDENDLIYGRTHQNIGIVMQHLGRYKDALQHFNLALSIYIQHYGEKHINTADVCHNIGIIMLDLGKYEEALEYFNNVLPTYIQYYGKQHIKITEIYLSIGNVLDSLGKYEEALQKFNDVLSAYHQHYEKENIKIAIVFNNIGGTNLNLGKYEEALQRFKQALSIYIQYYGEKNINTAAIKENIGIAMRNLGMYKEALQHHKFVLPLYVQHYGENHIKTIIIYRNIGILKLDMGRYKKALKYFKQVLPTYIQYYGEQHIKTVGIYQNIGNALSELKQFEKALKYYNEALLAYDRYYEEQDINTLEIYQNIGVVKLKLGKYEEALQYFDNALPKFILYYGKHHINTIMIYKSIGIVMQHLGRYEYALRHFNIALSIYIQHYGENHINTADVCHNIGIIMLDLGKYDEALKHFNHALPTYIQYYGKQHIKITEIYLNIRNVLSSLGQYEEELKYYYRALKISIKYYGKYHKKSVKVYQEIGSVLQNLGKHDEALQKYKFNLNMNILQYGKYHRATALSFEKVGFSNLLLMKCDEALKSYNKAFSIIIKYCMNKDVREEIIYLLIAAGYAHFNKQNSLAYFEQISQIFSKNLSGLTIQNFTQNKELKHLIQNVCETDKFSKFVFEFFPKIFEKIPCNNIQLSLLYENIGDLFFFLAEYNKSLEYFKLAIEIKECCFGNENFETALTYRKIGDNNLMLNKFDLALLYYHKSLPLIIKNRGKEHVDNAQIYESIATANQSLGQYQEALKYHEKSLVIKGKQLDKCNIQIKRTCEMLEHIYNKIGNKFGAEKYSIKLLRVLIQQFSVFIDQGILNFSHLDYFIQYRMNFQSITEICLSLKKMFEECEQYRGHIGKVYKYFASKFESVGMYVEATIYYNDSLNAQICNSKMNNDRKINLLTTYGRKFDTLEQFNSANKCYEMIVAIMIKCGKEDSVELIKLYENIEKNYEKLNMIAEAIECYEKMIKIRLYSKGQNSIELLRFYQIFAKKFKQIKKIDGAVEYYKKTIAIDVENINDAAFEMFKVYEEFVIKFQELKNLSKIIKSYVKIACARFRSDEKKKIEAVKLYHILAIAFEKLSKSKEVIICCKNIDEIDIRNNEKADVELAEIYEIVAKKLETLTQLKMAMRFYRISGTIFAQNVEARRTKVEKFYKFKNDRLQIDYIEKISFYLKKNQLINQEIEHFKVEITKFYEYGTKKNGFHEINNDAIYCYQQLIFILNQKASKYNSMLKKLQEHIEKKDAIRSKCKEKINFYQEDIVILKRKASEIDIKIAILYENIARNAEIQNKIDEAINNYEIALDIRTNVYSNDFACFAKTCSLFFEKLQTLTQKDCSFNYYPKLLKIVKNGYGKNHIYKGWIHECYANKLISIGNYENALKNYNIALPMFIEKYGEMHYLTIKLTQIIKKCNINKQEQLKFQFYNFSRQT